MALNRHDPNFAIMMQNLLYSNIGRSIDGLVRYEYWAHMDPEGPISQFSQTVVAQKVSSAINELVTHQVRLLLSSIHGIQPQPLEALIPPDDSSDHSINTIVKTRVAHILTVHGYTATPRVDPPQTVNQDLPVPPPEQRPQQPPQRQSSAPGPESGHPHQFQDQQIRQSRPTLLPAPILHPSPMIPESSHTRPESDVSDSNDGSQGETSNSSEESEGDVDMPYLSPDDIPSPNYMFDMPGSDDESSPDDPTISDPNHPNYRPLFTYEPLDRTSDGPSAIIPPRRAEPPSPDAAPETP